MFKQSVVEKQVPATMSEAVDESKLADDHPAETAPIKCSPTFSGMVRVFDEAADSHMRNANVPLDMAIQRAWIDHDACFVTLSSNMCSC